MGGCTAIQLKGAVVRPGVLGVYRHSLDNKGTWRSHGKYRIQWDSEREGGSWQVNDGGSAGELRCIPAPGSSHPTPVSCKNWQERVGGDFVPAEVRVSCITNMPEIGLFVDGFDLHGASPMLGIHTDVTTYGRKLQAEYAIVHEGTGELYGFGEIMVQDGDFLLGEPLWDREPTVGSYRFVVHLVDPDVDCTFESSACPKAYARDESNFQVFSSKQFGNGGEVDVCAEKEGLRLHYPSEGKMQYLLDRDSFDCTIRNDSDQEIAFHVDYDGQYLHVDPELITVPPGEEVDVRIRWSPLVWGARAHTGAMPVVFTETSTGRIVTRTVTVDVEKAEKGVLVYGPSTFFEVSLGKGAQESICKQYSIELRGNRGPGQLRLVRDSIGTSYLTIEPQTVETDSITLKPGPDNAFEFDVCVDARQELLNFTRIEVEFDGEIVEAFAVVIQSESTESPPKSDTLAAPDNVRVAFYVHSIAIAWDAVPGAQGYGVYKVIGEDYRFLATVSKDSTEFVDFSPNRRDGNRYAVSVWGDAGESAFSAVVSANLKPLEEGRIPKTTPENAPLRTLLLRFAYPTTQHEETVFDDHHWSEETKKASDHIAQLSEGQFLVSIEVEDVVLVPGPPSGLRDGEYLHHAFVREAVAYAQQTLEVDWHAVDFLVLAFPKMKNLSSGYADDNYYGILVEDREFSEIAYLTGNYSTRTIVHEILHLLDLPDLYWDEEDDPGRQFGVGRWGVMGGGYAGLSAWSRVDVGWVTPREITASQKNVSISVGEVIKIPVSSSKEYFLVEIPQQGESFRFLPEVGVLVWHVRPEHTETGEDGKEYDQWLDLVEASEHQDLELPDGEWDDPTDPFYRDNPTPGYTNRVAPQLVDGTSAGFVLSNFSEAATTMTFDIVFGDSEDAIGPVPKTEKGATNSLLHCLSEEDQVWTAEANDENTAVKYFVDGQSLIEVTVEPQTPKSQSSWTDKNWVAHDKLPTCLSKLPKDSIHWTRKEIPLWVLQELSHNEVAVFQTTQKDCGPDGIGYAMVTSGENAALTLDSGNIAAFLDDAAPNAILIGHMHVHDKATIFPSRSDYAFLERQSKKNGQKTSLIYPKQGDYAYRFGLPDSQHYDPATWALACEEWEGFESEASSSDTGAEKSQIIPTWFRNNADWWLQNQIDDKTFIQGLLFLAEKGVIDLGLEPGDETLSSAIDSIELPEWLQTTVGAWKDGITSDDEFVSSMRHYIDVGVIALGNSEQSAIDVLFLYTQTAETQATSAYAMQQEVRDAVTGVNAMLESGVNVQMAGEGAFGVVYEERQESLALVLEDLRNGNIPEADMLRSKYASDFTILVVSDYSEISPQKTISANHAQVVVARSSNDSVMAERIAHALGSGLGCEGQDGDGALSYDCADIIARMAPIVASYDGRDFSDQFAKFVNWLQKSAGSTGETFGNLFQQFEEFVQSSISTETSTEGGEYGQIPSWVQNIVRLWVEGAITDEEFLDNISYLASIGVLDFGPVPGTDPRASVLYVEGGMPEWWKDTFSVWSEGLSSDAELIKFFRFFIDQGVLEWRNQYVVAPELIEPESISQEASFPEVPSLEELDSSWSEYGPEVFGGGTARQWKGEIQGEEQTWVFVYGLYAGGDQSSLVRSYAGGTLDVGSERIRIVDAWSDYSLEGTWNSYGPEIFGYPVKIWVGESGLDLSTKVFVYDLDGLDVDVLAEVYRPVLQGALPGSIEFVDVGALKKQGSDTSSEHLIPKVTRLTIADPPHRKPTWDMDTFYRWIVVAGPDDAKVRVDTQVHQSDPVRIIDNLITGERTAIYIAEYGVHVEFPVSHDVRAVVVYDLENVVQQKYESTHARYPPGARPVTAADFLEVVDSVENVDLSEGFWRETVSIPGWVEPVLHVKTPPEGLVYEGPEGGPFVAKDPTIRIENGGTIPLSWEAVRNSESEFDFRTDPRFTMKGELEPSESYEFPAFEIASADLEPGTYTAQLDVGIEGRADFEAWTEIPATLTVLPPKPIPSVDPTAEIDLMVLYTAAAEKEAGGATQVEQQIRDGLKEVNQIFERSGIVAKVQLAGDQIFPIDYDEVSLPLLTLEGAGLLLRGAPGIAVIRAKYRPDVTVFVMKNSGYVDAAGVAVTPFLLVPHTIVSLEHTSAFGMVLAHELGHVLGCGHEDRGIFPYSIGHNFETTDGRKYVTIMRYPQRFYYQYPLIVPSQRLRRFSNPRITATDGTPLGHPEKGDCARTINHTAPIVAAYNGQDPSAYIANGLEVAQDPFRVAVAGLDDAAMELHKITGMSRVTPQWVQEAISEWVREADPNGELNGTIPEWVRNTVRWWIQEQISEQEFLDALEYLVSKRIIDLGFEEVSKGTGPVFFQLNGELPGWLPTNLGAWAEGKATDAEFVGVLRYLIKHGPIELQQYMVTINKVDSSTEKNTIKVFYDTRGATLALDLFVTGEANAVYARNLGVSLTGSGTQEFPIPWDENRPPHGSYKIVAHLRDSSSEHCNGLLCPTAFATNVVAYIFVHNQVYDPNELEELEELELPQWVRNTVRWWIEKEISDEELLGTLSYLISEDIIPVVVEGRNSGEQVVLVAPDGLEFPSWIRGDAISWVEGRANDYLFIRSLNHLIDSGIVEVHRPDLYVAARDEVASIYSRLGIDCTTGVADDAAPEYQASHHTFCVELGRLEHEDGISLESDPHLPLSSEFDVEMVVARAKNAATTLASFESGGKKRSSGKFVLGQPGESCDEVCGSEGMLCQGAGSVGMHCGAYADVSQCEEPGYWIYHDTREQSGGGESCLADWGTSDICTNNYNLNNSACCFCGDTRTVVDAKTGAAGLTSGETGGLSHCLAEERIVPKLDSSNTRAEFTVNGQRVSVKVEPQTPKSESSWSDEYWVAHDKLPKCLSKLPKDSIHWTEEKIPLWVLQELSHNEVAVFQTTAKDCGLDGIGYAMVTSGENAALTLESDNIAAFLDAAPNAILIGHVHVHDKATIFPSRDDYAFLERQSKKNGQRDSLIYPKQGDYAYRFGLPDSQYYDPTTWGVVCKEWQSSVESSDNAVIGGPDCEGFVVMGDLCLSPVGEVERAGDTLSDSVVQIRQWLELAEEYRVFAVGVSKTLQTEYKSLGQEERQRKSHAITETLASAQWFQSKAVAGCREILQQFQVVAGDAPCDQIFGAAPDVDLDALIAGEVQTGPDVTIDECGLQNLNCSVDPNSAEVHIVSSNPVLVHNAETNLDVAENWQIALVLVNKGRSSVTYDVTASDDVIVVEESKQVPGHSSQMVWLGLDANKASQLPAGIYQHSITFHNRTTGTTMVRSISVEIKSNAGAKKSAQWPACTLGLGGDSSSQMDLVAAYTTTVRQSTGGKQAIESNIILEICEVNQILMNSQLSARVRLKAMREVLYRESNNTRDDIAKLKMRSPASPLHEVQRLWQSQQADLMMLFVSNAYDAGGRSGSLGWGVWAPLGVVVVGGMNATTHNYVTAHEIGHSLGCDHQREVEHSATIFPGGYGHVVEEEGVRMGSVMTVVDLDANVGIDIQIPYFSNPSIHPSFLGQVPIGEFPNESDGAESDGADCASLIHKTARFVASVDGDWDAGSGLEVTHPLDTEDVLHTLKFYGPAGGPFFPKDVVLTVSNPGSTFLPWDNFTGNADQFSIASTPHYGGLLAPGGTVSLSVEIYESSTSNLKPGTYDNWAAIWGVASDSAVRRPIKLHILPRDTKDMSRINDKAQALQQIEDELVRLKEDLALHDAQYESHSANYNSMNEQSHEIEQLLRTYKQDIEKVRRTYEETLPYYHAKLQGDSDPLSIYEMVQSVDEIYDQIPDWIYELTLHNEALTREIGQEPDIGDVSRPKYEGLSHCLAGPGVRTRLKEAKRRVRACSGRDESVCTGRAADAEVPVQLGR